MKHSNKKKLIMQMHLFLKNQKELVCLNKLKQMKEMKDLL